MRRTAAACGAAIAVGMVWWKPGNLHDFVFDWLTSRAIWRQHDPYASMADVATTQGFTLGLPQSHPRLPGAHLIQLPIGLLPEGAWYHIGRILTVAAVVWFLWLLARWTDTRWEWWVAATPIFLLLWPFSYVLVSSKWGSVLVAGLIGITVLARRREWWTGIPLGLAVTMKVWPWLLVPALWLAGRRKAAYGAAGTVAALNLAGFLLPGVSLEGLVFALESIDGYRSLSWIARAGLPAWTSVIIGIVALVLVWWAIPRQLLPAAIPIALLVSPILWNAYLPVLAVTGVLVWRQTARSDTAIRTKTGAKDPSSNTTNASPPTTKDQSEELLS